MGRKRSIQTEVVSWSSSLEWGQMWGFLPDPDVILGNTGLDVTVFDALLSDAHVFACYQSRKAGVLTSEYRINYPKGSENTTKYFDTLISNLDMDNVIAQILDAPFYGFSVNEVMWDLVDGKFVPIDLKQKPNQWFVWDFDGRLRFLSRNAQLNGELLPDMKFIVPRHFATYKNPYGMRTLSRCFWPVAFKKGGYKYWTQFMEKFGIPWLIGKVPRGTSKEVRDDLVSKLGSMVQSAVAVINDDESIETLDNSGRGVARGGDNIFHMMIEASNSEISKAILTQTLTTEIGDKGAYAATQSHLQVRNELCQMDKKLVKNAMNLLFDWCCKLNFSGIAEPPRFAFIEEEDPKEAHARRDTQLSTQGVRFKEDYYQRVYNLRPGEFEVTDPQPAGFDQQSNNKVQDQKRVEKRTETREDPKKSTKPKDKK